MSNNHNTPQITFRNYLQTRYGPNILKTFRKWENTCKKLALSENSVTFLCKCRNSRIIPKGLKLKAPYHSARSFNIIKRASEALVRERIQFHRHNKVTLISEINKLQENVRRSVSQQDFDRMYININNSYIKTHNQQKQTHINKYLRLIEQQHQQQLELLPDNTYINKTVINLSSKELSATDKLVLCKGLKYAVAPKKINKLDLVAAIEETAQKLPEEQRDEYRIRNKIIIEKRFKPKQNITQQEKQSIHTLKHDNTIKILPADKGNATVVIDIDTYNTKIDTLIQEGQYTKLNKDPTKSIERKIYTTLFKHKGEFTNIERTQITPHFSKPPHFYGLPKIHKPNIPLRPIVSSIGSPCHKLARFLLKILNPLSGKTDSFINNTPHFLEKLQDAHINTQHLMVSFDVVSLFTNVPVDKTLHIIKQRLENDGTLHNRTTLSVNTIMELLTLCIKTTYFQLNNNFFQQDFGIAMGSPLSPVVSNIFMEDFEQQHIKNYTNKPTIWWRYVDDVFAIWPHDANELNIFLDYINNQENSIKFTVETETNSQLPFLDTLITKTGNIIKTSVYRKKTHTNRYLHFKSNHHLNTKIGVVKSLYDRAKIICSNNEILNHEKEFILQILKKNGYPENLVSNTFKKIDQKQHQQQTQLLQPQQQDTTEQRFINITLPYIPGMSDKIKRIGNKFNVRTIFKTENTLRSMLTKTKPLNEEQNSKNCIYSIPCECGKYYIGETSRPLNVRIKEHQYLIKTFQIEKSKIAEHAWNNNHKILWNNTKTISKEPKSTRRKIKETAYILLNRDKCISDFSIDLNNTWLSTLRKEI